MDVLKFLQVSDGYGDGCGYGYGDGVGGGYGNGYGYGCGDGVGYGNGYGYGCGYGYGVGYGNGDGVGGGVGDGVGGGIEKIRNQPVHIIDSTQTIITAIHGNVAKGFILQGDLQLKPCYVVKGNNLFAHGKTLREAQKALEDKIFEDMDVEDKIAEFKKQFKLNTKYPVKNFYEWHHKLTGSCEMGRSQFAQDHGIDIKNGEMTVSEFVELTKNSYGGEIISQLEVKRNGNKC